MRASSIIAIYTLFWSISFFFVLPFRLRSGSAPEAMVPGQAESAPERFSLKRTAIWTTWLSLALFGLFYANYVTDFIKPQWFDLHGGGMARDDSGSNVEG